MRRRRDILLPFYAAECILLPADNEGRYLVWSVSEDTLSIETPGAEFSFTLPYFGVRSRAGRERRRTESGRRKTELFFTSASERGETGRCPNKISRFLQIVPEFFHATGKVHSHAELSASESNLVVHLCMQKCQSWTDMPPSGWAS